MAASGCFLGLFAVAYLRDGVRRLAADPYFRLSDVPVNPQWGPLVLFAVFLVLGVLAVIALVCPARIRREKE